MPKAARTRQPPNFGPRSAAAPSSARAAAASPYATGEGVCEALRALRGRLNAHLRGAASEPRGEPPVLFDWDEAEGSIYCRSVRLVADTAGGRLRCSWGHVDEPLVSACLPLLERL